MASSQRAISAKLHTRRMEALSFSGPTAPPREHHGPTDLGIEAILSACTSQPRPPRAWRTSVLTTPRSSTEEGARAARLQRVRAQASSRFELVLLRPSMLSGCFYPTSFCRALSPVVKLLLAGYGATKRPPSWVGAASQVAASGRESQSRHPGLPHLRFVQTSPLCAWKYATKKLKTWEKVASRTPGVDRQPQQ